MNNELMDAIEYIEREKDIPREIIFSTIETALTNAYQHHYGKSEVSKKAFSNESAKYTNVKVEVDRETAEYRIYSLKEVVEEVFDPVLEISLEDAKLRDPDAKLDDILPVQVEIKDMGRIAAAAAKSVIQQKIREKERDIIYEYYKQKEKQIVTGVVQRRINMGLLINLGKADAILKDREMVPRERLNKGDRIKVYVTEVTSPEKDSGSRNQKSSKNSIKGSRIYVSRTHPDLVKRLFESEVTEVADGTVEIKAISREVGSRTKIAVYSNNPDVDPVGACVGLNGERVNAIVDELRGEKIDIVNWDENPAILIENALSPSKVILVITDGEAKTAKVTVPDNQLSLAIGKEGQNARLAARLTGFKIDIKSESEAINTPGFRLEDYYDENGELVDDTLDIDEEYSEEEYDAVDGYEEVNEDIPADEGEYSDEEISVDEAVDDEAAPEDEEALDEAASADGE